MHWRGRRAAPGERRRAGLQEELQNHNRVYVAQIEQVHEQQGTMTVVTTGGQRQRLLIPLPGLSFQGFDSAWIRYMPQARDHVLIGYGPDNRPHCLGMTAFGHDGEEEPAWQQGGYAVAAKRTREAQPPPGMREFVELKGGEWDMRSSGGCYMHGSSTGVLTLSGGGQTRMVVDKDRNELSVGVAMFEYAEGGVLLRIGDVKRPLAGRAKDQEPVSGGGKAYELDVGVTNAAGVTINTYEARYGDVRDGVVGAQVTGPVGPMRIRETVLDALGGSSVYEFTVDSSGNVDMTASAGRWTASCNTVALSGSTSATLDGGQIFVGTENVTTNPMILSSVYRAAEDTFFATIGGAPSAATFLQAAAAGMKANAEASVGPLAALKVGFESAQTALNAAAGALIAGYNIFNGASSTYVSTKAYNE